MARKKSWIGLIVLIFVCSVTLLPGNSKAAGQFISGSYGGKPYKLYVPDQYNESQSYPLYVMLHGCTQDASQFATGTKMNALADEKGFLVLYPEQTSSANSNKCWNWFESAHQSRGSGEPAVIAGMVNLIKNNYTVQGDQVYAAGLSAGAAMSVIMGAAYPDLFSGIGVGAGLEYKAATSMTGAFTAMSSGGPDPVRQGRAAYQAMGSQADTMPVIVFHGTSDYTVAPVNGNQVITQWAVTNDLAKNAKEDGWIDDQPDQTENLAVPGGKSYTVSHYKAGDGRVWMKKVAVQSMGHAWSGGNVQGSYTDPQGPDASLMMWEFFHSFADNDDGGNDGDAPATSASPKGGTYNQPVYVELQTNKEASTYYTVDGSNPTAQSTLYTGPIYISGNTTLKFFSQDSSGQKESVKEEVYIIEEDAPPPGDSLTFSAISGESGFAGRFTADGKGSGDIKAGDKGMYNTDTFRGILSFDTSTLGQTAIGSAKLRLYTKSSTGAVTEIKIDLKNGTFGSASIEQSDYSAAATLTNMASFQPAAVSNYIDIDIPASALAQINRSGKTQFRLKAATAASFNQNSVLFYGGGNGDLSPVLIITSAN
ncbi:extracellular catalytic domain type 1 short-chain-length polyhydroxyalkanoate depolymerase [Bacillus infantis]|uniref:extracellular catalytic domain type 1 short-chain-length polyhydroxyalkanoate depolymerase n=1 Tax=Bacillus infantis TaxID=324767 RepID=UPI003CF319BB